MASPGGYTVLVSNSISLIIVKREFNQRERHLKILVVVIISTRVFQTTFQIIQSSATCPRMKLVLTHLLGGRKRYLVY